MVSICSVDWVAFGFSVVVTVGSTFVRPGLVCAETVRTEPSKIKKMKKQYWQKNKFFFICFCLENYEKYYESNFVAFRVHLQPHKTHSANQYLVYYLQHNQSTDHYEKN
jgi:hypothetical protein